MSSKQDIINNIYFDRAGFGSRATTLKDARAKDKTITMDDVNEFFRKNVEEKDDHGVKIVLFLHLLIGSTNLIYFLFPKMT